MSDQPSPSGIRWMIAAIALFVLGNILNWMTNGPWEWIGGSLTIVAVIIGGTGLVRMVRKQRGDYWRERGHDRQNI